MNFFILSLCFALSLVVNGQNNSNSINMNINMNMNIESNEQNTSELNQNSNMNINLNIEENSNTTPNHNQGMTNTSQPEVVYVAGYTGKIGCTPPVSSERIKDMSNTIENQSFSDDKIRVSKQIIRTNCITVEQLIVLLENFDFEDSKLEMAKYAYNHVYDLENYYKVYNVFSFSSSGEELEEYIEDQN